MSELVPASRIASILGLSARAVRNKAQAGALPGAYRLDGAWRFDEPTIRAWRERQRVKGTCQPIRAAKSGGSVFRPKVAKSDNRLEQLLGLSPAR